MVDGGNGVAGSYAVVAPDLVSYAGEVSGLAGELRGALDVAGHVRVTADAYGQTCEQLASLLNLVADAAEKVIEAGIGALETAGTNLRDTATSYADQETAAAEGFTGITGQLG